MLIGKFSENNTQIKTSVPGSMIALVAVAGNLPKNSQLTLEYRGNDFFRLIDDQLYLEELAEFGYEDQKGHPAYGALGSIIVPLTPNGDTSFEGGEYVYTLEGLSAGDEVNLYVISVGNKSVSYYEYKKERTVDSDLYVMSLSHPTIWPKTDLKTIQFGDIELTREEMETYANRMRGIHSTTNGVANYGIDGFISLMPNNYRVEYSTSKTRDYTARKEKEYGI